MKPSLRTIAKRDHSPRSPRKRRSARGRKAEQIATVATPPLSTSPSPSVSGREPQPTLAAHGAAQPLDPAAPQPDLATQQPSPAAQQPDLAAQKVREAGGPLDRASYSCQCGYLFAATVTTTVECPHCGASQAW